MRRRIRIGTIVVLAVSGLGAYSAFAALQSADPQSSSSSISATKAIKNPIPYKSVILSLKHHPNRMMKSGS